MDRSPENEHCHHLLTLILLQTLIEFFGHTLVEGPIISITINFCLNKLLITAY